MTDRELLDLAAKAAGIEITWEHGQDYPERVELFRGHLANYEPWDPLNDDGDAFRLGVACGVLGSREVAHHKALLCLFSDYDKLELERRAIVLAVAEAQQAKEAK